MRQIGCFWFYFQMLVDTTLGHPVIASWLEQYLWLKKSLFVDRLVIFYFSLCVSGGGGLHPRQHCNFGSQFA